MKLELKRGEIPPHLLKYFKSIQHKPKDLIDTPSMLSEGMRRDGWILRSECVWVKPNPMPESVTDRPTKSHEMVYLFAKNARYWYDADAIREPATEAGREYSFTTPYKVVGRAGGNPTGNEANGKMLSYTHRNRRDVFTVTTEATPFAHFATFPQALIEPLILAGCPEKVCAECGKPYVREVEATGGTIGKAWTNGITEEWLQKGKAVAGSGLGSRKDAKGETYTRVDKGLHRACKCETTDTRAGVCLDPFMGSGTTAIVARRLGRHYVGIELNAEYAALAETRLQHTSKDELNAALSGKPTTLPMFE